MTHHDHKHPHDIFSTLSFEEKMIKRLEHWIRHNDHHVQTYRDWAKKAKENDMDNVGELLEDVVAMMLMVSKQFDKALAIVRRK